MLYSYIPEDEKVRLTLSANLLEQKELIYMTTGFQTNCFGRALQAIEDGTVNAEAMITTNSRGMIISKL